VTAAPICFVNVCSEYYLGASRLQSHILFAHMEKKNGGKRIRYVLPANYRPHPSNWQNESYPIKACLKGEFVTESLLDVSSHFQARRFLEMPQF
jgi:hypothetical protein